MGTVIQMAATTGGGTQDALQSIDVPANGRLIGVQWAIEGDADADADSMRLELSFASTNMLSSNDARAVLSTIRGQAQLVTSGLVINAINVYIPLPLVRVFAGERLYIHAVTTAATVFVVTCQLHFDFDLDQALLRRR